MNARREASIRRRGAKATRDIVALVPCGGHATRIQPLPCSKEILPVGLRSAVDGSTRFKVVSHYLLEQLQRGGIPRAFFILRKGKWDIPEYYGDGAAFGLDLGYLIVRLPHGPAYTLDQAYPFVRGARVALGFPDILFGPPDAYARAIARLDETRSDLVLGLYRAHDPQAGDVIDVDRTGRVRDLVIKPPATKLRLGWIFAVWTPPFTEFMHQYLSVPRTSAQQPGSRLPAELSVGHVLQAAIRDGLYTQSVVFPQHDYVDIGTPEGLERALIGGERQAGWRASS